MSAFPGIPGTVEQELRNAIGAAPPDTVSWRIRIDGRGSRTFPAPARERAIISAWGWALQRLQPGDRLRLDPLDSGGHALSCPVRSSWTIPRPSTPRPQELPPMPTQTQTAQTAQPRILDIDPPQALQELPPGVAGQGVSAPAALVQLVQTQAAQLVSMAQAQTVAAQVAAQEHTRLSTVLAEALTQQSRELRMLSTSVATRDAELVQQVIEAQGARAEAEIGAALSLAGGDSADSPTQALQAVAELIGNVKAGDPSQLLPRMVRRLAAGEGEDSLRSAVAQLSEPERVALGARLLSLFGT